jgi:hypothetical protein
MLLVPVLVVLLVVLYCFKCSRFEFANSVQFG